MKKIYAFPLMAMAMLTAASGAAHAQHVAGGMGEEVRIGAFAGATLRGDSNRGVPNGRAFNAAKPAKGPARSANHQVARPLSVRGAAPTLPGRNLP
jgi:hypothetical protein